MPNYKNARGVMSIKGRSEEIIRNGRDGNGYKPKSKPTAWKQAAIDAGFRSEEEWKFWLWLKELEENQVVFNPKYVDKNPDFTWELSPKRSYFNGKEFKSLLIKHVFNIDFVFDGLSRYFLGVFHNKNIRYGHQKDTFNYLADVKGSYLDRGSEAEFKINQKWLYDKHGIFVNMVIPDKLFKKTFAPEILMTTPKTLKPSKYSVYKTCQEWLATIK